MEEKILFRHERKFIINNYLLNNKSDLENIISQNLNENYKSRRVNSIYYDTEDLKLAKEALEGLYRKDKIRIRYYGKINFLENLKLEIKTKKGNLGKKDYINLNYEDLINNKFLLIKYGQKAVFKNKYINDLLTVVRPKIFLTYKRHYFLTDCKRFRFTLDKNICFKLLFSNISSLNFDKNLVNNFQNQILELKYDSSYDNNANLLTQNLPYRLTSFSKYNIALNYFNFLKF